MRKFVQVGVYPRNRRRLIAAGAGAVASALLPPLPVQAQRPRPRIALALGTGSMHGIVFIGVLRACERLGFRPDLITGTSAGAVAGALWAGGRSADQIRDLFDQMSFWKLAMLPRSLNGLARNTGLAQLVNQAVGDKPIEQLAMPFAAVATDVMQGSRVVLDRGDTGLAVAASACVPVLFEPVNLGGRQLVDGALTEPIPVRAARERGAQRVIAIDVQFRPYEEPPGHAVGIGFQAMQILVGSLLREQIEEADLKVRLDVHQLMLKPHHVDTLVDAGEQAFERLWPTVQQWMGVATAIG